MERIRLFWGCRGQGAPTSWSSDLSCEDCEAVEGGGPSSTVSSTLNPSPVAGHPEPTVCSGAGWSPTFRGGSPPASRWPPHPTRRQGWGATQQARARGRGRGEGRGGGGARSDEGRGGRAPVRLLGAQLSSGRRVLTLSWETHRPPAPRLQLLQLGLGLGSAQVGRLGAQPSDPRGSLARQGERASPFPCAPRTASKHQQA